MAWTGIARREHSREGLRYSSDMTDRERALAAPFIPAAKDWRLASDDGHARSAERTATLHLPVGGNGGYPNGFGGFAGASTAGPNGECTRWDLPFNQSQPSGVASPRNHLYH